MCTRIKVLNLAHTLECGWCCGKKLLDHVVKILESVIEVRIRTKLNID